MNRLWVIAVLWLGILTLVAMGLFPPWLHDRVQFSEPLGYRPLWDPPAASRGVRVDFARLGLQWLLVLVVVGGILATLRLAGRNKGDGVVGSNGG